MSSLTNIQELIKLHGCCFSELEKYNNWGIEGYRIYDLKVQFESTIRVQWPNGLETTHSVVMQERTSVVGDMGHTYTTNYKFPYIEAELNGAKVLVPIEDVLIDLATVKLIEEK